MKLLYFAPSSFGGLADYARCQARALVEQGVELDVLCAPQFSFVAPTTTHPFRRHSVLADEPAGPRRGRIARASRMLSQVVGNYRQLAHTVRTGGFQHVLMSAYAEYFAPLWSPALRALARRGVIFGAVVHDPVRDAMLGPRWWHRRSVADAFSFLRYAFVHEAVALDTARPTPGLHTAVIPHGPYRFATSTPSREAARQRLGLPPHVPVVLAFGHIRDNKNLHLMVEALTDFPDVHLVVAGHELSSGQRPAGFYQSLARQLGVETRCHWHVRFIPEDETGWFFAAADYVSLTYSAGFHSASGVLNAAVQFRKPCIASSGPGPLRTAVESYQLGVLVAPDDGTALRGGLTQLLTGTTQPLWDGYTRDNSWERNAEIIVETMWPPTS